MSDTENPYAEDGRQRKQSANRESKREKIAEAIATSMPQDPRALLDAAAEAVESLHRAAMGCDANGVEAAEQRYQAAIWKLNGGTFFGCIADEDSAGNLVIRHCQAEPGQVPKWGQNGEFVTVVDGVRVWVECSFWLMLGPHFSFHAIDLDGPFLSETGYRSHFSEIGLGKSVEEIAQLEVAALLKNSRRYLRPEYQNRLAQNPLPVWLHSLDPPPRRVWAIEEEIQDDGPLPPGFERVDVVLPAAKAFIVKKWDLNARKKIEALRR